MARDASIGDSSLRAAIGMPGVVSRVRIDRQVAARDSNSLLNERG